MSDLLPWLSGAFLLLRVAVWAGRWQLGRRGPLPPRTTDLRAVYPFPPSEEERRFIRMNRPRLRDIAGWDPETVARMNAQIRAAAIRERQPSFLDVVRTGGGAVRPGAGSSDRAAPVAGTQTPAA